MKITVYLKSEVPFKHPASHSISQTLCGLILADGSGKLVLEDAKRALILLTGETLRQVKDRLKNPFHIPVIHAPLPYSENLDLAYPQKSQETLRHPHHAMREACRAAKERQIAARF